MKFNIFLGCAAAVILSACAGTGGGGGDATAVSVTFQELQSRGETFFAAIGSDNFEEVEASEFANLPTAGALNYTGIAAVGIEAEGDNDENTFLALGSATFVADFDEHEISGSADNFFQISDPNVDNLADATGTRIAGNLAFEFDQVAADQNFYGGQITGALTPDDLPEVTVDLAGGGAFIGDNAEAFGAEAFNDSSDVFVAIFANQN